MLNNLPILSFLTFLPLFGAFVILLTCSDDAQGAKNSKMVALWTSLITFILSLVVLFNFDKDLNNFQFVEKAQWFPFLIFRIIWGLMVSRFHLLFCPLFLFQYVYYQVLTV